ncbi:hypothetical protein LUZ60_003875 [Juncus effusus]|nr:hypothetical protein LUZ60_003875 [Juncus effusus]
MASKFGLAGGIPERRVRPIWDAVDSRQFKAALKLSASLLQKYPKSPYALALKALILERMGKSDEALNACLNAKQLLESDKAPFLDDLTLSTLQIVFQRLDRLDLGTSCYEQACTKYLNNLEIMMGLFNCHVREYSYVKQQQTAIKMYKAVGEERFLLWAVCSIQLQVIFSTGGEKLLPLAEALIKKHIASHSLHEPEALTIYISILEQQGKYDSALEIISGELGDLIGREEDKLRLQGRLLSRSDDYSAASQIFQKVLESCPDDWELFQHYLACLLEENIVWSNEANSFVNKESSTKLTEELFNSRLSSALSLVEKLQKDATENCTRGPFLAQIEIQKRLRLNGNSNNINFMDTLLNYFTRFGHLSNCASDVELYLHLLEEKERIELLERISSLEISSDSQSISLGRSTTLFKIQEICGSMWKKSIQELEIGASKKVELFCKNLSLSKDLDPQENLHGEELLVMASNTLVMLFWRTKNLRYLLEAILVLEFGLNIRRYTWQYKIPLVHIYSHLNALPLACDWYRTLDVKNILLETLSHHILPQTLISPLLNEASEFSKDYLKFIDDHLKESADLTCLAYRHRNYSKAIEFVRFKERLQHSSQYLMTKLDYFILELKSKANNPDEFEKVLESMDYGMKLLELVEGNKVECLTTNGDLQSRPWWTPTPTVNYLSIPFDEECATACFGPKSDKTNTENPTPQTLSFERKALVPRLVLLSMLSQRNQTQNAESANRSSVNIVGELGTLLEKYARTIGFSFNDAVQAILSISNGQKSFQDFPTDMVSCISFAVFINAWNCSASKSSDKDGVQNAINWEVLDRLVKLSINEKSRNPNPGLTHPGNEIPVLAQLVTEPFTWHILVIQSYLKSVIPLGKKKKKNEKLNASILPQLKIVQSSINCLIESIGEINKWILDEVNKNEESDLDVLMGYLGENNGILGVLKENLERSEKVEVGERIFELIKSWDFGEVLRRLVGAQRKLLKEFGLICESKLKLLESLKQNV